MSGEARREQVLDAAKAIVDERGFHAVSIEAVARAAGITRPIVYGHFGDLPGLLHALVDRETARARAQLEAIVPTDLSRGDAREILLAGLRGYLDAVRADPATWRLVLMPAEGTPEVLHDRIDEGRATVIAVLAAALGRAQLDSPDLELTARALSALSDEAARLILRDPGEYPVERVLAHSAWLLDGLLARRTALR